MIPFHIKVYLAILISLSQLHKMTYLKKRNSIKIISKYWNLSSYSLVGPGLSQFAMFTQGGQMCSPGPAVHWSHWAVSDPRVVIQRRHQVVRISRIRLTGHPASHTMASSGAASTQAQHPCVTSLRHCIWSGNGVFFEKAIKSET